MLNPIFIIAIKLLELIKIITLTDRKQIPKFGLCAILGAKFGTTYRYYNSRQKNNK